MQNHLNFIKVFVACITLTGCTECKSNWVYPKIKYSFLQSVSLNPNQKSYKKLDTIKIEILIPNKILFDTLSKMAVKTDSISLPLRLPVFNLNTAQPPPLNGYFDLVDSDGQRQVIDTFYSYINNGINFSTTVDCSLNADYLLKFGIVLKDTGVYMMSVSGGHVLPCTFTNSPQYYYSQVDYFFNLSDFNEDIYNSIPQSTRKEGRVDFGTKQQFVFHVSE
jgi:hypothetical protein